MPRCLNSSLRQPGCPECQDPWLCVTRSLWFCPFGEPFCLTDVKSPRLLLEHKVFQQMQRFYVPSLYDWKYYQYKKNQLKTYGHNLCTTQTDPRQSFDVVIFRNIRAAAASQTHPFTSQCTFTRFSGLQPNIAPGEDCSKWIF